MSFVESIGQPTAELWDAYTEDEFTPTLGEFVNSFNPTQWFQFNVENTFYWTVKGSMLVIPSAMRAAMLMRTGMGIGQAFYMAGDTWSMYRFMTKPARMAGMAGRAVPVAALAGMSVAGARAYTSAYDRHVVQHAPEHQQSGLWRFLSAMLTGTGPSASYTDI